MDNNKAKAYEKRLLIDITKEEHNEIKMRASLRNVSIKTWVMRAIQEAIVREKKYE